MFGVPGLAFDDLELADALDDDEPHTSKRKFSPKYFLLLESTGFFK